MRRFLGLTLSCIYIFQGYSLPMYVANTLGGFLNEEVVRCQDVISSQMSGHMHTCYKISSSA